MPEFMEAISELVGAKKLQKKPRFQRRYSEEFEEVDSPNDDT
jgi:hypothetical protein